MKSMACVAGLVRLLNHLKSIEHVDRRATIRDSWAKSPHAMPNSTTTISSVRSRN
jgi:hypothetical protein